MDDWTLSPWIGHPDQGLQIRRFTLAEGRSDGLSCIDVQNSAGLSFTIAPGRAMSLQGARFLGHNLTYIPSGGFTGPSSAWELERYFEGGLLFTCGLDSTGPANGIYGQHGQLRRLPAQDVSVRRFTSSEGIPSAEITGRVIQGGLAQPTLMLERQFFCSDNYPRITIRDTIRNLSCRDAGFLLMYHLNLGWPLLSPHARLQIPSQRIIPKNETAAACLAQYQEISPPVANWTPQVLFHKMDDKSNLARVVLENPEIGIGVALCFDTRQLPWMAQWRNFQAGEYVLGLEPCLLPPRGRARIEEEGDLPILKPGESRTFDLDFEVWSLKGV